MAGGDRPKKTTLIATAIFVVILIVGIVLGVTLGRTTKSSYKPKNNASSETNGETLVSPSASPVSSPTTSTTSSPPSTTTPTTTPTGPTVAPTPFPSSEPGTIVSGTTSNNIDFLSCTSADRNNSKQIALLHGSSFTKETWNSDNMLESFCSGSDTVVALDLPVSTDYQGLIEVLEALQSSQVIKLPVTTLVTPSASGYSIVSWMLSDDVSDLPNYVSEWVPVATGSLLSASDDQVTALQTLFPELRILAITGNDDTAGGKYSARLATLAGATAVELTGRHAVYLQSPDDFVQTILDF
jgi:hypothetical protein